MELTVYAVPALFALLAKIFIFIYAQRSPVRNVATRLYLLFLFALAVQNIAELTFFVRVGGERLEAPPGGIAYFGASIIALAAAVHLAAVLALGWGRDAARYYVVMIYAPAIALEALLWFSPWMVAGFEPLQYTYTRVAGPLYFLFEIYAVVYVGAVITLLGIGAKRADSAAQRIKNQVALVGLLPAALIVVSAVVFLHFGVRWFNSTVTFPVAMTFFLFVTAYATHQHRLFDIVFYIPWSKVRQRKTAFYGRIRAMIAEIADLGSIDTAVQRLADTLRCPVALIGGQRPAVAAAGAGNFRVDVPDIVLRRFDHIVVRNEIAGAMPEMHALMKRHGIAAVVPFHPHSEFAAGWLLLGDSFNEQVYTRLDFQVVEELFDKMADLFLDRLITMRAQLADAYRQIRALEMRHEEMQGHLLALKSENDQLGVANAWLRAQQPVDSISSENAGRGAQAQTTITLVGRDKERCKELRRRFAHLANYASVNSSGFRRQPPPDVLLVHLEAGSAAETKALARFLATADPRLAVLLYGSGARQFLEENKREVLGRVIEVADEAEGEGRWNRRIDATIELAKSLYAVPHPDQPLLGVSDAFVQQMQQANALAGLVDPIVIKTEDAGAACALAQYIHERSAAAGGFRVLRQNDLERDEQPGTGQWLEGFLAPVHGGTLVIENIDAFDAGLARNLLARLRAMRIIVTCNLDYDADSLLAPLRPFTLRMPGLLERKADLPLLVHYFTLQFNAQSGQSRYLLRSELDELLLTGCPRTVLALKYLVFDALARTSGADISDAAIEIAEAPVGASDKTLDEHVAEFEARIIAETLKRCGGNKSKTARLLGLRPNTLHYKLERYGMSGPGKDS